MTTPELVTTLQRQGFTLQPLPDGKLSVMPAGKLTEALRTEVRERKDEIVKLLVSNRPYLNDRGELIVPFDCDARYHWWAGGQSVAETLQELAAPPEVWRRYVMGYKETRQ